MRDDQERAAPGCEESLQPLEHSQIEMIRRLVQQEQIRVGKECLGESDAGLLTTAERAHRLVQLFVAEPETHQHFFGSMLDVKPAGHFEVKTEAFIFRKELVELVAGCGLHCRFELSHPRQRGERFLERELSFLSHRPLALEARLLAENGDARAACDRDLAFGSSRQDRRRSGAG